MRLDPSIVRQQIANLKLLHPDLFEDDEAWLMSLESETDITALLAAVLEQMREASTMAGAIASRRAELDERLARYERKEQAGRKLSLGLMQAAGVRKMELPEATLSVRKGGTKLVISDEEAVTDEYTVTVRKPDKNAIKAAIEGGAALNWAALVQSDETLSVRTK